MTPICFWMAILPIFIFHLFIAFTYLGQSFIFLSDSLRFKLAAILSFFFCSVDLPPWKLCDRCDRLPPDLSQFSFRLTTELALLSLIFSLLDLLLSLLWLLSLDESVANLDLDKFRKSLAAFCKRVDSRLSTGFLWIGLSSFCLQKKINALSWV